MVFKVNKLTARMQNKQKSISQSKDSEWPFSIEQLKYVSKTSTHSTHLKMYGKGAEFDEIRESATIDVSIDISRPNVIIAFKVLEHV